MSNSNLKKAKAEHKKLKKYGVNEIGWYEDRGEVAEWHSHENWNAKNSQKHHDALNATES